MQLFITVEELGVLLLCSIMGHRSLTTFLLLLGDGHRKMCEWEFSENAEFTNATPLPFICAAFFVIIICHFSILQWYLLYP